MAHLILLGRIPFLAKYAYSCVCICVRVCVFVCMCVRVCACVCGQTPILKVLKVSFKSLKRWRALLFKMIEDTRKKYLHNNLLQPK